MTWNYIGVFSFREYDSLRQVIDGSIKHMTGHQLKVIGKEDEQVERGGQNSEMTQAHMNQLDRSISHNNRASDGDTLLPIIPLIGLEDLDAK